MRCEAPGVLVVDDDPSVTDMLVAGLEEEGYRCSASASGEEAMAQLAETDFDVTLLDLRLPGMSGMDVLREVRARRYRTAVVVITGLADARTAVEAMKLGATDFVTKPFDLDELYSSVAGAWRAATGAAPSSSRYGDGATAGDGPDAWRRHLDSIARGVAMRLGRYLGEMTVVAETAGIARGLGIPERRVAEWAWAQQERHARWVSLASLASRGHEPA